LKTYYVRSSDFLLKVSIFLLVLFSGLTASAQVEEEDEETPRDTIGYNTGRVNLGNPPSVVDLYTYDPATDRYVYTSSIGDFNINYPQYLTPKEYESRLLKESMRKYFQAKVDAIDGKKEGADQKDLLPRYYVNSSFFETIFGSNTIDVKPTGSVEMDLGIRYTKQDNPSISPRNRSTLTFDFDQRINLSLMGKVGTRLSVTANYDTESTFAFQNMIKLEYTPTEDDIIQKIELGNVSLPLNSTLITGAQSLFGVKLQLQFGKTTVTGIFSEQKSQTRAVTAQGGGTIQEFDLFALDYDSDRHFFLSQYFRNRYDVSMRNYPLIDSRVQITRIEVWVTNKQNRVSQTDNNLRNIVALQDLGEAQYPGMDSNEVVYLNPIPAGFFNVAPGTPTDNKNNDFDPNLIQTGGGLLNPAIRESWSTADGFTGVTVNEGQDYSKLENARKLTPNEFTYHPQLGYISLQQRLANDEVLAVAFQYTIGDQVYQVGEFANGGVESTNVTGTTPETQEITTNSLVLKMLKSNLTTVENSVGGVSYTTPVWNLMMKNVYQIAPGGQLEQEDFRFNILYSDPSPLNYITQVGATPLPADVEQTPLLKVFNVDRLNYTNDPQDGGDGFFDFIPGLTVDSQNGRIIFTTVEPFGSHLFNKLGGGDYDNPASYNANQAKYVYRSMYRSTPARALQDSDKNKFELRGKFKSTAGEGIAIGAYNVPKGSVVVTAGGRVLVEGLDYQVNYQQGRVTILDPSLANSSVPIDISVENNSVFGQQTRRFMGVNVEHKFSDKFQVGATFLKMTERPFTQKSNYGQESVNNTIFGANANYATEVPFLTRLVNKLPNIDTDVPSNISVRGEVAFLKPDAPKADQFQGEATIYVDDFEGSQTTIDMKSPLAWSLASVPVRTNEATNPSFGGEGLGIETGFKRAKLSWYSIDPIFYTSQRPGSLTDADLATNKTRRVYIRELFPQTDIADGQQTVINTLDLTYYPSERGPYNFNPAAAGSNTLPNPESNFGGIMRSLSSTNFEQSNVEYIQFWMLDPYVGRDGDAISPTNTGRIYFNLGEISEDVLKDGRKQYENGLPEAGSTQNTQSSPWGRLPQSQSLIYAFDTNEANRRVQDVGLDGLDDEAEAAMFPGFASLPDPAADNYRFYLSQEGSIQERYKDYNNTQGNSPVNVSDTNRGNSTLPDVEDINRDNTMNTIDAYYQYSIELRPGMVVGENYITDIRDTNGQIPGPGNQTVPGRWIQFKIPLDQANKEKVGPIEDFRSIRFMRMYMTGFSEEVTVRFATLDLVRGEWRRFVNSLDPQDPDVDDDDTNFDVQSVNIQENGNRYPIKYITPPGVVREQLYNNNTVINQNEQSLALRITGSAPSGLEPGDARAVFKNVSVDMRQFNKLKMFLHAESLVDDVDASRLQDNEMAAIVRFGNDFTANYYQLELPLITTQWSDANSASKVWPEENEIDLRMSLLTKLKIMAMQDPQGFDENDVYSKYEDELDPSLANKPNKLKLSIKGNPNFGQVRTLMVGLKNNTRGGTAPDGAALVERPIQGEVWFNELRLADMNNKGGMAAIISLDGNLADFATISATGRMSTIGFGSLEAGPNERDREDMQQYNIVTNLNLGKLMPKKWGINLPFNYGVGEEIITPEYDPFNQDIRLDQLLNVTEGEAEKANIRERAIEYTKTKSINFIGVKKERGPEQKPHVYDPENITLSYSFNETEKHDYEIQEYVDQQLRTSADYAYNFQSKPVEPFKNNKFFKKSSYWKLLSDFNFNYLPSNINFSSTILRQYNRQQFRQVDDIEGLLAMDPLYRRNYLFNKQYGFNYNITKGLKVNFTGSSSNIVRSYLDEEGQPTIWEDYWNVGEPNQHMQQLTVNYELPLSKLPFLSFLKSTYTYTGDYTWQRSSDAMIAFEDENNVVWNLGNTIQNNSSHRLNTTLNLDSFYKYIGLGKKPPVRRTAATVVPKPGEKISNPNQPAAAASPWKDFLVGVVTSVKNVQVNYTETAGTVLPGYLPGIGFFGTSKPTLGFVFGSQDDVRYEAAKRGYLTTYPEFNQNYTTVLSKTLDMTANIDLIPDLKIDLTANRQYMSNHSEQYDVDPASGMYNARAPYDFGNFSISTILIKTAFEQSDENMSETFNKFRENRLTIAQRLAAERPGHPGTVDDDGFPTGFGKNSQRVLLPAFLAAYTGTDASGTSMDAFKSFPMPNWSIKYTGLMRLQFFKDKFKRFSLQHTYRASYTVNSFRSNFDYDQPGGWAGVDAAGNYNSPLLISNVNLVEQFNPLVKVDMEMKNSMKIMAEMKKDRAMSLSFDNNLLTEVQGYEYVLGLGYRIKDVIFNSVLADNPTGVIRSDIDLKADFSLRSTKTIVRYLDYDNNQLGGGQNIWSVKFTARYDFSRNLSATFYYDHQFSKAVISTAFPITNILSGFTLKYTFGN
jgi:cell surface protein SprA